MPVDYDNLTPALKARVLPVGFNAAAARQFTGARALNVLRVAANVADTETVVIGPDTYEVETVATATGVNTSGNQWNNTNDPIQVTVTAHGLVAGDLLAVGTEIFKILRVVDANTLVVSRGRAGTTNAVHADAVAINKGNGITAGRIPVGLIATFTPAAFTPALAAEINNALTANKERHVAKASTIFGIVQATSLQAGAEMLLAAISPGVLALACTETLAGVNNVWAAAAMFGGAAAANKKTAVVSRVPTADEVALGFMRFPMGFTPTKVVVFVKVTATGIDKVWNGGALISGTRVDVDNTGVTDWAVTDTVTVYAEE